MAHGRFLHMRECSCSAPMTEQICMLCYLSPCAFLFRWRMPRILALLHIAFPNSQRVKKKSVLWKSIVITDRLYCLEQCWWLNAFFYQCFSREMSQNTTFSDSNVQKLETNVSIQDWGSVGKILLWPGKTLDNKAYRKEDWIKVAQNLYMSLQSTNACLVFAL